MTKIIVNNSGITLVSINNQDYISLTDMAHAKESESREAEIPELCVAQKTINYQNLKLLKVLII